MKHFLTHLQESLQTRWNAPSLTDYEGKTSYTLGQVAEQMEKLSTLLDLMGIQAGDKVALCGKNCANWGVSFLALMASRRVAVTILPDFTPEAVQSLVNHSEASVFFTSSAIWSSVDIEQMPGLKAVVLLEDFSMAYSANAKIAGSYEQWDEAFGKRFPNGFSLADVHYDVENMDDLALINYTSGTTSAPKGVMLSYRSISSNVHACYEHTTLYGDEKLVSILPMAHMFGLATEYLFEVTAGIHIYFLLKTPTPQLLLKAFGEIKPFMIVTVPLVLEKVFRKSIFPKLQKPMMRILWNTPLVNIAIRRAVRKAFIRTFGGNLRYIMIGGAALNQDVEHCMRQLRLPYIVGYGMTECGPLIAFEDWYNFAENSCGKTIQRMEIRIDSDDPERVPGEIQTRGQNLMLGYYKNEEASRTALTEDGWLHTGDMGIMDKKGNLFIKGRCKNMILGPSGQNIYPEELEDKINSLPLVSESLCLDRDGKIIALIYLDPMATREHTKESIDSQMKLAMKIINAILPKYSQIAGFEIVEQEFEKTPKRSIKRYLYK